MFNSINLGNRSYDDVLTDSLAQIPLLTNEWTDFNLSDPGVTMLQNLSAFSILAQSKLNDVSDKSLFNLLALGGVFPEKARPSLVFLQNNYEEALVLPEQSKLFSDGLCCETTRITRLNPGKISAVFCKNEDKLLDITPILPSQNADFQIQNPETCELYFLFTHELKKKLPFYMFFTVSKNSKRNPTNEKMGFATLKFEYYTADGFCPVKALDGTDAFIKNGMVKLSVNREGIPFSIGGREGYAIKVTFENPQYDVLPRIYSVSENLFPVMQKETFARSFSFKKKVKLNSDLCKDDFFVVLGKEKDGTLSRYTEGEGEGNFYSKIMEDDGSVSINLNNNTEGNVVVYTEQAMINRFLGKVYGYENQVIDISMKGIVCEDDFTVLAAKITDDGSKSFFEIVSPNLKGDTDMQYSIDVLNNQIIIHSAGKLESCELYLCDYAVTRGRIGNVIRNNSFIFETNTGEKLQFINPLDGTLGADHSSTDDLKDKFKNTISTPKSLATAADYINAVKNTAGLCLHKVGIIDSDEINFVKIVVKPISDDKLPKLSEFYKEQILKVINERRLISTRVDVKSPRYAPIDVSVTLVVKNDGADIKSQAIAIFENIIDQTKNEDSFSTPIRYNNIWNNLFTIPSVTNVQSLIIMSANKDLALSQGRDIFPESDVLCYVNNVSITVQNDSIGYSREDW